VKFVVEVRERKGWKKIPELTVDGFTAEIINL
jgi:hypothetical protein